MMVEVEGVNIPLATKGVPEPVKLIVRFEASKVPVLIFKTEPTLMSLAAVKVVPT